MPAPTAAELIRQAYVLAQVWDPGEEQPGVEAQEGLLALNTLISEWSSVGTLIPAYKVLTLALAQNAYLITQSPPITDVMEAHIIDNANCQSTLYEVNLQQFNTLNFTDRLGRPNRYYVEFKPTQIQTTTNLYFWPPADADYTVTLYVKQFITEFDFSDTITTLPLNYFKALKYQLARDLHDVYLTVLSDTFPQEYDAVMTRLKGTNRKDLSSQNRNIFYENRRYRPWNIYAS